jgi:ribosome-associated protein
LAVIETSLDDDQATDVITIDLKGKSSLGDYMIIASGRSTRHVSAIADHVLTGIKAAGFGTAQTEGQSAGDWVLIDAGDIIIHLFRPEVREFYNLEKMWSPSLIDDETENLETAS